MGCAWAVDAAAVRRCKACRLRVLDPLAVPSSSAVLAYTGLSCSQEYDHETRIAELSRLDRDLPACPGCLERRRQCARFHDASFAGGQGVQVLVEGIAEKRTGRRVLLSFRLYPGLQPAGAHVLGESREV